MQRHTELELGAVSFSFRMHVTQSSLQWLC